MHVLWLFSLLASAEPPGRVLPTVEAATVPALYAEYAAARGDQGAARELACEPLVGDVWLCFKVEVDGKRRYVTQADLALWATDTSGLRTQAAGVHGESSLLKAQTLDTGEVWWEAKGPDAAAVLLHPEWLSAVGANPVVAVPAKGVVVAWDAGDADLDKIMAVGVRQMFETLEHPVTPVVFRWSGTHWVRWGQATPQ
jgi:hypothetical protein